MRAIALVSALMLFACGTRDIVAELVETLPPPTCVGSACDAGVTPDAGCAGAACALDAAATSDPNLSSVALCTCEGLLAGAMVALAADEIEGTPASIATRGAVHLEAPVAVAGSLTVGPARDVTGTSDATLQVGADLAVDGNIEADIAIDVAGDAQVAGDVRVRSLRVGGSLTLPADRELSVTETLEYGVLLRQPVQLAAPCACDDADLRPAAARLERARGATGVTRLDDGRYGGFTGAEDMSLMCGEYWVASVAGDGDLSIDVQAPATLYVDGAVSIQGALDVRLAPGAALTLVVLDAIQVGGAAALGVPEASERVEIVVDGTQIALHQGGTLHGAVIAPAAELLVDGPLRMRGSASTRRIAANAELDATFATRVALPSCN
jgi:cytoskeletal protein CcmA (bactofilin family)